jgi:excisionase family DNA binding protein
MSIPRRSIATIVPRIALTPPEAAAALGCGETYFNELVRPELRVIRRGRKVLIPVVELQRWAADNMEELMR